MTEPEGRLVAVAVQLLEKTKSGLVAWKEGSRRDEFRVAMKGGSVGISETGSTGFQHVHKLFVLDKNDALVAAIDSADPSYGKPSSAVLAELFESARRTALRVDAVIDEVMDDVYSLGSNAEEPFWS